MVSQKVTTNFLTEQESQGIVSPRPSEANPRICYCGKPYFPRGESEAILMLASQSGKCVCFAFVLAAGVHLSSEMGF